MLSEVDWGVQIDLGSRKFSQVLSSHVYRISATEYSMPMEETKRNQVSKQNLSGKKQKEQTGKTKKQQQFKSNALYYIH